MTIKEIAELTGRARRTVQDWITNNPGENCQAILAKTDRAEKEGKAADFTLDETIEILRAGKIGENLISILKNKKELEENFKFVKTDWTHFCDGCDLYINNGLDCPEFVDCRGGIYKKKEAVK